jgi:hypothetical protein
MAAGIPDFFFLSGVIPRDLRLPSKSASLKFSSWFRKFSKRSRGSDFASETC